MEDNFENTVGAMKTSTNTTNQSDSTPSIAIDFAPTKVKQPLFITTDAPLALSTHSETPFEPTSAVDLERCNIAHVDARIEEDIRDYRNQEKEFRKKNKWSMFSMLYGPLFPK
jgi:hypothetical protein